MQPVKEIPHSTKIKLAPKGRELDPFEVELAAIRKFGIRSYRQRLEEHFDCSKTLIFYAFNKKAPFMLYMINNYVNDNQQINSHKNIS